MDYNQNHHNDQNRDNGQWDRWNSSSSNNSYYNQPVRKPSGQAFAMASGVCGILSLSTCCIVIVSLPLAALGVLFAVLAYRKGRKMSNSCVTGILFSGIGLACSAALIIFSLIMLPLFMKNDAFRGQFDAITQQMYGMDFSEFMEEYYGYSIEE